MILALLNSTATPRAFTHRPAVQASASGDFVYSPASASLLQGGGERFAADGWDSTSKVQQRSGRKYVQCLLDELGLGRYVTWVTQAACASEADGSLERELTTVLAQLKIKVEREERWRLSAGDCWGDDECRLGDDGRPRGRVILLDHVERDVPAALRRSINDAREDPTLRDKCTHLKALRHGFIQELPAWRSAKRMLEKRADDCARAKGKEADQSREVMLRDDEQIEVIESILSGALKKKQAEQGLPFRSQRKPVQSLNLGLVLTWYLAMRQRGMCVRRPRYCPLSAPVHFVRPCAQEHRSPATRVPRH